MNISIEGYLVTSVVDSLCPPVSLDVDTCPERGVLLRIHSAQGTTTIELPQAAALLLIEELAVALRSKMIKGSSGP